MRAPSLAIPIGDRLLTLICPKADGGMNAVKNFTDVEARGGNMRQNGPRERAPWLVAVKRDRAMFGR